MCGFFMYECANGLSQLLNHAVSSAHLYIHIRAYPTLLAVKL